MFQELKEKRHESTISKSQKRNKCNKKEANANSRDDYSNWKDGPEIWDGRSRISELENQSIEIIQSKEQKNRQNKERWIISETCSRGKKQTFQHRCSGIFWKAEIKGQKKIWIHND